MHIYISDFLSGMLAKHIQLGTREWRTMMQKQQGDGGAGSGGRERGEIEKRENEWEERVEIWRERYTDSKVKDRSELEGWREID